MRKFLIILFVFFSLNSLGRVEGMIHDKNVKRMSNIDDTVWTEGKIVKIPFKNKKDAASKMVVEYRFKSGGNEYFIKYCEGKIKKDDLIPYVGKKLKTQGVFKTGLFDVCPGENQQDVQSRAGEYVAIIEIKK